MHEHEIQAIVDEIFSLYELYGKDDYIGEPVSQVEHMCQAAQLAEADGFGEGVILAAFFHDIGHLCEHIMTVGQMKGYGVIDHERLAGMYLRAKGFSNELALLVENHVSAKRYLTYRYPSYYNKLSEASRITLEQQGGVMNEEEARVFENDGLSPLYIKLREWDDQAKVEGLSLPPLGYYREMAIRHLKAQN